MTEAQRIISLLTLVLVKLGVSADEISDFVANCEQIAKEGEHKP